MSSTLLLSASPDKLFVIHTDVTQSSSIAAAVDMIIDEAGALHDMTVDI